MAGANNRALKAHGFKAREIQKIRKGYGVISSAKEAALAAKQVGVRVPPKLATRLDGTTSKVGAAAPGTKSAAAKPVEQGFGSAAKNVERQIRSQNAEIQKGDPAAKLARKLTDNDVRIMQVAQSEFQVFKRTGTYDRSRLTKPEWKRAERLMDILDRAA